MRAQSASGLREDGEGRVGREPDDDGVAEGPEAGHLTQRDPQHQHDEAEEDDRLAQGHRHVPDEARVEDVPRRQAEHPAHHHRQRDAVEEQPEEAAGQPSAEPAGAQLRDRTELGEGGRLRLDGGAHASSVPRLALLDMANHGIVASMSRTISAQRVATLVDGFHRSPAYVGLAESLRVLIGDGRIGLDVRLPSEREAHRRSRRLACHRDPRLRPAPRDRVRRGASWCRDVHPGARRRAASPTTAP